MPQTFQVLRCYKCKVFQVHPTKKSNKWICKLCGEKQSMKRFYGLGTGKECRLHVQKLNGIRGELDVSQGSTDMCDLSSLSETSDTSEQNIAPTISFAKKSKWLDYVDPMTEDQRQNPVESMHLNNTQVVLELPKKIPRRGSNVVDKLKTQHKTQVESFNDNSSMPTHLTNNYTMDNVVKSSTKNCKEKKSDCMTKSLHKVNKYVPPMVTNTRWAHFVEETESNDENDIDPNIQAHNSAVPVLPFLDDDDENLDSILDL